jgi:hypothetical protein
MRAGLWAGFVTAAGTTAFLLAAGSLLPDGMDLRGMAFIVDPLKYPGAALAIGAVNHIAAGSAIGLIYGRLTPRFTPLTGIACLMVFWLAVMLVGFPLVGRGLFGLRDGVSLLLWTLALFIIFGAAMGVLARWRLARAS